MDSWILWLARGCGLGRSPIAPGTVGSIGGLLWFLFLVSTGFLWSFLTGTLLGLAASVWICGKAEKLLAQKDPGQIVLDEVVAIPVVFLPWVLSGWLREGTMPPVEEFFVGWHWIVTTIFFILFRVFDIAKPWPVGKSQKLAGGWGVTMDDVLAAIYVALISLFFVV